MAAQNDVTITKLALDAPYPVGRITWSHSNTDTENNKVYLRLEPFDSTNPDHHRPPPSQKPRDSEARDTRPASPGMEHHEGPGDRHRGQMEIEDEASYVATYGASTIDTSESSSSQYTPVSVDWHSIASGDMAHEKEKDDDDDEGNGHGDPNNGYAIQGSRWGDEAGMGGWLPAELDKSKFHSQFPDTPHDQEDIANMTPEYVIKTVERSREEMYASRLRGVHAR